MKRVNTLAGLLLLPLSVFGAGENAGTALTVTGEVYRLCEVSMPENATFRLGDFVVSNWVENQSWLSPGTTPEFIFTLTGCGVGNAVTISATGTPVNTTDRVSWLANQTGTAPELAASVELIKTDGTAVPLPLDGTVYPYTTISNISAPTEVKLKGLLRRTDNGNRPVGTYQATLTIHFEFS